MNRLTISVLLSLTFLVSGCSINHPVAQDYTQHLAKYGKETRLPQSTVEGQYVLAPQTQAHRYQFRAATVGYAHIWIVEFGKILDQTLAADYVQSAFGRFEKNQQSTTTQDHLFEFELQNYQFKDYRAYVSLNVRISKGDQLVFEQTYQVEGEAKGGQMFFGGPFAMKNATLTSTKNAIDKILTQLINEINQQGLAKGSTIG